MSMINDALRRASSAAPAAATPPPLPVTVASSSLSPVTQPSSSPTLPAFVREEVQETNSKLPIILVALFIVCAAGAIAVYVWEKRSKSTTPPKVSSPVLADSAKPATLDSNVKADSGEGKPLSIVAKASSPAASEAVSVTPESEKVVEFPKLRLQTIFYKRSNPSVMINGRTLFVNDEIQGVSVAAIEPSSVTLVLSGRTNVLTLR